MDLLYTLQATVSSLSYDILVKESVYDIMNEMLSDLTIWDTRCQSLQRDHSTSSLHFQLQQSQHQVLQCHEEINDLKMEKKKIQKQGREYGKQLGKYLLERNTTMKTDESQENDENHIPVHELVEKETIISELRKEIKQLKREKQFMLLFPDGEMKEEKPRVRPLSASPLGPLQMAASRLGLSTSTMSSSAFFETSKNIENSHIQKAHVFQFDQLQDPVLLLIFGTLDSSDQMKMFSLSTFLNIKFTAIFGMKNYLTGKKKIPKEIVEEVKKPAFSFSKFAQPAKSQMSKIDQIVSSMNKAEMKLFHELMTRIKQLENQVAKMQIGKEDLSERLHGSENVKEFLMGKLKEVEDELANTMEESVRVSGKASSDREVIGYLDARTQQLEKSLQYYIRENQELTLDLQQAQATSTSGVTVAQDMTELLATEKQEIEKKAKAQRKLLVRELKTTRSQNLKVSAERDSYRKELKQLRDHVLRLKSLD